MNKDNVTLVIIDVQKAFDDKKWGERKNPHVDEGENGSITSTKELFCRLTYWISHD